MGAKKRHNWVHRDSPISLAKPLREQGRLKLLADISIGELSRRTECGVETVRYYERIGLLPEPRREGGRFRRYDEDDISRLRFIRRARRLGFTLNDVRSLLRLAAERGDSACAEARQIAVARVEDVRGKIADLRALERILTGAICDCDAGRGPDCPILGTLREPAGGGAPA